MNRERKKLEMARGGDWLMMSGQGDGERFHEMMKVRRNGCG